MKRLAVLLAALAPLLCIPAASARAAAPPRASLSRFSCHRALQPMGRSFSVRATMRPVAGTWSMRLRFELLQQTASGTRSVTGAGDLGMWVAPHDPTIGRQPRDVWMRDKRVSDLDAPATYRFRVTFRWLDGRGRALRTVVRVTRRCRQPDMRPDLLVRDITVSPVAGHPARERYTAVVANHGGTAAGPFAVLFAPGGKAAAQSVQVAGLAARATRKVSFVGPSCDGSSPPTIVADSADQVDDANRDDNAVTVTCP